MNKWNILVAEDDIGFNRLISNKLEKEDFVIRSVTDGKEALISIKSLWPDLLLLDYQMNELGAPEIIQNMKELKIDIPFIIFTGHGDEHIAVEMMKAGAMDYLIKDAEFPNIFIAKVKNALHHLATERELRHSKSKIIESEERFRMMAENSFDVIWQLNLRLTIIYLSSSSEHLFGIRTQEIVGKHLWEMCSRIEFIRIARIAINALNNYKNFKHILFESKMVIKDGSEVPVEISGKFLKNSNARVIGFQGLIRDISEQKKIRDQMVYQNNLINALINNIPDQIYVKDRNSKYLLNNAGHIKEFGIKNQEELLGRSDHDFFNKESADEFRADEERILFKGESIINKEEYKTYKNGQYKWTLTTKVPLRDAEGNITGLAGINRDITRRKEQEEEIIRSRYELAIKNKIANIFLNNDHDTLFDKLLNTFLSESNSKVGFMGYISSQGILVIPAISEHLQLYKDNDIHDMVLSPDKWGGVWGQALKEKRAIYKNENLSFPENYLRLKNALAVPILLGDKLLGVITMAEKTGGFSAVEVKLLEEICNYIAPIMEAMLMEQKMRKEKDNAFLELQLAKEKADDSNKLKSAFLLNLSHELRTPLNSIIGFTNLLAKQYKNDEKTGRFANMIEMAGHDLIKMVEDTIDISILESNDFQVEMKEVYLETLLDDLFKEFSRDNKSKYPQLELLYQKTERQILVSLDRYRFKKAIDKILDNACKFTESGSVTMAINLNGKNVELFITDTGIGIPRELTEAVFEKFRKVVDKKVLYRGNGLGLSISKGLLEAMGCNIILDSNVGEGTKVSVSIPLA